MAFRNRSCVGMFFLMYFFAGMYQLYWTVSLQNEIKRRNGGIGGGLTLLLIIVTFGLYAPVWQWQTCCMIKKYGGSDNRILTLVLSLFAIGI